MLGVDHVDRSPKSWLSITWHLVASGRQEFAKVAVLFALADTSAHPLKGVRVSPAHANRLGQAERRLAPWLAKKCAWSGWAEPKMAITVATLMLCSLAPVARVFPGRSAPCDPIGYDPRQHESSAT